MRRPWLIVGGDFTTVGGMDRANYALASRLLVTGHEVHLVTHRADSTLRRAGAVVHGAPRPAGAHALGMPLLAARARRAAAELDGRRAHTVINGGNCSLEGVNWVHYVHAAYDPVPDAAGVGKAIAAIQRRYVLARERAALGRARLVICNSARTQRDVVEHLRVPGSRTRIVYYGIDPLRFASPDAEKRRQAREGLDVHDSRRIVLFVGALGDRRKGFDALFAAWAALGREGWDDHLLVVGEGRELHAWRQRANARGLGSVRFLGLRRDVSSLLAAADLLVHPARYEAYGLAVHEAICSGVPAIVSAAAGVAERYPSVLSPLLLPEVSERSVRAALEAWRANEGTYREAALAAGAEWRTRTWDDMADEIIALADC